MHAPTPLHGHRLPLHVHCLSFGYFGIRVSSRPLCIRWQFDRRICVCGCVEHGPAPRPYPDDWPPRIRWAHCHPTWTYVGLDWASVATVSSSWAQFHLKLILLNLNSVCLISLLPEATPMRPVNLVPLLRLFRCFACAVASLVRLLLWVRCPRISTAAWVRVECRLPFGSTLL
jgi:hypothetical protein